MDQTTFVPRRVAIIGSGAMGCYYGGRLAQHGADVSFHMRRDLSHVLQHGLTVRSCRGDFALPKVHAVANTTEIGPVDLVIITLKSTANSALDTLMPPLLHDQTRILTLQNGLGNEEYLAQSWGADRVLGGVCFTCINRTAPGRIEHTAQGNVSLGALTEASRDAAMAVGALFNRSAISCDVIPCIPAVRWQKLVWNIPFNGLAILGGGIDTAQILNDPSLALLTKALMSEVIACAAMLGYHMPEGLVENQFAVTRDMAQYRPSSMIDFIEGREVEIEAIWGEPWRQALAAGAQAPRLETVYRLLSSAVARR